jgi:hypothetical protein
MEAFATDRWAKAKNSGAKLAKLFFLNVDVVS